ncbi:MAG TPA: undecaprenyldiphospho-muramoylpentapeptide beta-N-acetylglucosaminyltransferase [Bacillota bacterium]
MTDERLRVMMTGGGTGGHVYPALAVASELRRLVPAVEFLYVGTREGLESRIVPAAGLPFRSVRARGFIRKRPLDLVRAVLDLARGYRTALVLVRAFRPAVVLGTGGYVMAPVILAAARCRVPVVLHEQNALPGVANRWLSRYADVVAVPFDEAVAAFPRARRVEVTGNPTRPEILTARTPDARRELGLDPDRPVVLITSGSRGARSLNRAAVEWIRGGELPAQVLLSTGHAYHSEVVRSLASAGLDAGALAGRGVVVVPYLERMDLALAAASLAVTRAGALTIAELTARGVPAILVPSPNVTHDHQHRNAELLRRAGAAVLLPDAELSGARVGREVERLLSDGERLAAMARAAAALGRPDAGRRLAELLLEAAGRGSR